MFTHIFENIDVPPLWLAAAALGVAVVAYILGCFNGSVVVSRYILRDDVRAHGSGNAGLTNFYRTFGGPLTLAVILSDVLKAVLAVLFGAFIAGRLSPELVVLSKYWAGVFCLLGHMYPCTFQFRGGKGILSGGTIVWMIDWRVGLVAWVLFLVLAVLTRYVSLGSIAAAASFPVTSAIVYRDGLITLFAVFLGGLVIWKHRSNIVRLVKGTESKFTLHRKQPAEAAPTEPEDAPAEAPVEAASEVPEESAGAGSEVSAEESAEAASEAPAEKLAPEEPAAEAPAGDGGEDEP